MTRPRLALAVLWGTTFIGGCSGDSPPVDPSGAADQVVRPASVKAIDLVATSYTMPEEWDASSAFHVAAHSDGRVLLGGASGLYELGEDVAQIDPTPVRGILTDDSLGFIIATDAGMRVYDTEMFDSAINEMLGETDVLELNRRKAETWLVTDTYLYELENGSLSSYPDLSAVSSMLMHDDSSYFVISHTDGKLSLLRDEGENLSSQNLSEELDELSLAAPGPQDRVFAVTSSNGLLVERIKVEGGVAWWPVALTTDPEDGGAAEIEQLVPDPVGGSLWLTAGSTLSRIDGGAVVAEVPWPSSISGGAELVATSDGAVWMNEGAELVRVGPESPPPSFAQHVVPWYANNCGSCHDPGGQIATVTRFGTYDSFSEQIEVIIQQVEDGLMPAGENELIGDPELPRNWRDGGMRP